MSHRGRHYHRPAWTQLHRRWLASLKSGQAVHHIVLEDCIAAVEAAMARRDRLEAHIEAVLPEWSRAPVVEALQALHGVQLVAAAEIGMAVGTVVNSRTTHADRSRLELSVSCADQLRATAAAGAAGQADPRHRMESSGAAVPTVSQARPGILCRRSASTW